MFFLTLKAYLLPDFFFLKIWVETQPNRTWVNFVNTKGSSLHCVFWWSK